MRSTLVNIALKSGRIIPPEVLEGIKTNNGFPVIFSLPGAGPGLDRKNVFENWKAALDSDWKDIFFGMDGDVLLPAGALEELREGLDKYSLYIFRNKEGFKHGLWGIRKALYYLIPLGSIEINFKFCPICQWIEAIKNANFKIGESKIRVSEININGGKYEN